MEAKTETIAATNVTGMKLTTPPDRTAAERMRRFRRRRKRRDTVTVRQRPKRDTVTVMPGRTVTESISPPAPIPVTETASHGLHRGLISCVTLIAALGLATVSGAFSVIGLTSVFLGSFWPVVGMGAMLELGKLAGVAW